LGTFCWNRCPLFGPLRTRSSKGTEKTHVAEAVLTFLRDLEASLEAMDRCAPHKNEKKRRALTALDNTCSALTLIFENEHILLHLSMFVVLPLPYLCKASARQKGGSFTSSQIYALSFHENFLNWKKVNFSDSFVFIMELVKRQPFALMHASAGLKNHHEIVLQAVKQHGWALRYASEAMQNDHKIVMGAVKTNWYALKYASVAQQDSREILLEAVKEKNNSLVSVKFKTGLEALTHICASNNAIVTALSYASPALKNDRALVLKAVKRNWNALASASAALKNDREIVWEAFRQNPYTLSFFNSVDDREMVLQAVKECGDLLQFASTELLDDREIVLEAVKQNGYALQYASEAMRNDHEIVLEAVKQSGYALEYASAALQDDREIVLEAVKQNGRALEYASAALQDDHEIIEEATRHLSDSDVDDTFEEADF
jgi:hypothetical protein